MGILVLWDDHDKTRLRMEFETSWRFDELERAIYEADQYIISVPQQVDIIIDIEGSEIPKDFMNLAKSLLANPQPRPNEGNRIIVGASKTIRTGYQTIRKAFGDKLAGREVFFADDLQDARIRLRGLRGA